MGSAGLAAWTNTPVALVTASRQIRAATAVALAGTGWDVAISYRFLAVGAAVRRMSTARGGWGAVIVNVSSRAAQLDSAGDYVDDAASKVAATP